MRHESKEACDQPCSLNGIPGEWVDVPLIDNSDASFKLEPIKNEILNTVIQKRVMKNYCFTVFQMNGFVFV